MEEEAAEEANVVDDVVVGDVTDLTLLCSGLSAVFHQGAALTTGSLMLSAPRSSGMLLSSLRYQSASESGEPEHLRRFVTGRVSAEVS